MRKVGFTEQDRAVPEAADAAAAKPQKAAAKRKANQKNETAPPGSEELNADDSNG